MFKRNISADEVEWVIMKGEILKDYPDDKPYASCLMFGMIYEKPVHVVVSQDIANSTCFVITAYQPDPAVWSQDFKTKN